MLLLCPHDSINRLPNRISSEMEELGPLEALPEEAEEAEEAEEGAAAEDENDAEEIDMYAGAEPQDPPPPPPPQQEGDPVRASRSHTSTTSRQAHKEMALTRREQVGRPYCHDSPHSDPLESRGD